MISGTLELNLLWYHTYNELSKAITTATQARYETKNWSSPQKQVELFITRWLD